MQVKRYTSEDAATWDDFVAASKNGTFILQRRYMDYHQDRYCDHSLLIWNEETLLAVLPAHAQESTLVSHAGLTYGGFVVGSSMKSPLMLAVFDATAAQLIADGFTCWVYKTIPHIYHRQPSEEDRYALFLANASLTRRDVLAVVAPHDRLPYQQRRQRAIARARKAALTLAEEDSLSEFWPLLEENLQSRHAARPVHTLAEIEYLQGRCPDAIRLFTCRREQSLLAGVLIFDSPRVAHAQYIASSDEGRQLGALDLLFDFLLTDPFAGKPWFDFGISNEEAGQVLNRGLIDQKEGFGARAVSHDHYQIPLASWTPGCLVKALR